MVTRRYADRKDWRRVIERGYCQTYLEIEGFTGYVSLLKVLKVTEPLYVTYNDKRICIVDDGYSWLQHFPLNEHHSVTTMFDAEGKIVQWYIDICHENGIENDIPWMEDLYLDIVILPTGDVIQLDVDELEEALVSGELNRDLYNIAWNEANKLKYLISRKEFDLINYSQGHKNLLMANITK